MAAISLDELLVEIEHAGLHVSNLFQIDDGSWRCNLRSKTLAFEFYDHPNPTAAVRGAIALAQHQQGIPLRQNKSRAVAQSLALAKASGADLLQRLGLK